MSTVARGADLAAQITDVLAADDPAPGVPTAIAAPGDGVGYWAGGPSVLHSDGTFWLAYRLRRPVDQGRGYANVLARSDDGVSFDPVATLTSEQFGCASLERPALVQLDGGGFRIYVSCSTPNSKHWWVEAVDLATDGTVGSRTMVLPGDAATAWKDVVVHRNGDDWQLWGCRHPVDDGDDQADRMTSWYATSRDGILGLARRGARPHAGTMGRPRHPDRQCRAGRRRLAGLLRRPGQCAGELARAHRRRVR
jgi:hypothetical protein